MLLEAGHIENTVVLTFRHIQCLHLVVTEVAWVLVSSGTQLQLQKILDPDYLPDYLSVYYDNDVSGLQEVGHVNNTVVLIFRDFQCLHLIYSYVALVLVFSVTQV